MSLLISRPQGQVATRLDAFDGIVTRKCRDGHLGAFVKCSMPARWGPQSGALCYPNHCHPLDAPVAGFSAPRGAFISVL